MFELIYKMLQQDKYYGVSKEIDIAKGINKMPITIKEALKLALRNIKTIKYYGN